MPRYLLLVAASVAALAQPPGRKLTTLERLELEHLEAVHKTRTKFAEQRKAPPQVSIYQDFRAVIHVHAEDADHTKGTRPEVLKAAKEVGVRVVMFTDHRGPKPDTWRGLRDGVLFLPGSEDDHLLRFPGDPALRFLSHLEERPDMSAEGFDGTEIYNRHADAMKDQEFIRYFQTAMKNPEEWAKITSKLKQYPDEVFNAGTDNLTIYTGRWDKEIQAHPFTGIAANDSHQNQIFNGAVFDPYAVSFLSVCTHILARELTEPAVRQSLGGGHAYVAHDWLADPTGFSLQAANNLGVFDMGDPVPLVGTTRITAQLPLEAHLKLLRSGTVVSDTTGARLEFPVKEAGAYRLEAWLPVDGEERPWIYSNPLYIAPPAPDAMRLPPAEISPTVEVRRDISYVDGKPEDAAKHKLDVYSPKREGARERGSGGARERESEGATSPVLFFIHGGAWRSGDRSLYTALGNRFAKDGLVTVIPSYRLAPTNPHPAQIEDVAAAFAWAVRNIAQYGGDPKRIYVAGHSAGGHLTALLTLDERWLKKHGLSAANIRGAIPMSGVYEIRGQDNVFGASADAKKEASPMTYVKAAGPPFLITYCQWDYLTLPAQAERFHAALTAASARSRVMFVPKRSHITEMVTVPQPGDLTAQAVLEFVK